MSDEKKPPRLHIIDNKPRQASKLSPEQAKSLFMTSAHLEWTTWAKSMGWRSTTPRYPEFDSWKKEKREILAREQAETISEALFSYQGHWHADVLKTLREYPEAPDAMLGILKKRINDIIVTINKDEENKKLGLDVEPAFAKIKTQELVSITAGLKMVTEAKHKALMIDGWSLRGAEQFTDPKQFEAPNLEDQTWKVQLINGQQLDEKGMQQLMKSYYDVPTGGAVIDVRNDPEELETT